MLPVVRGSPALPSSPPANRLATPKYPGSPISRLGIGRSASSTRAATPSPPPAGDDTILAPPPLRQCNTKPPPAAGQGKYKAAATIRPRCSTPIDDAKTGNPLRKLVVPSSGSSTHKVSRAGSSDCCSASVASSPKTPCPGNRRPISAAKNACAALSAAVTGSRCC